MPPVQSILPIYPRKLTWPTNLALSYIAWNYATRTSRRYESVPIKYLSRVIQPRGSSRAGKYIAPGDKQIRRTYTFLPADFLAPPPSLRSGLIAVNKIAASGIYCAGRRGRAQEHRSKIADNVAGSLCPVH